jgi:hypothetical protein
MSTTFEYSVRHGDKITHKSSTLAGVIKPDGYTAEDLVKHIEKTDLHRGPDEIFDIKIVSHDNKPILPPEGVSAIVSGSTLKDSRPLINQRRTNTIYKTATGDDVTPGKQSIEVPEPTLSSPEKTTTPTTPTV